MNVTPDLLVRAVGCTPALAGLYAPILDEVCRRYQIATPKRLAAFLAQLGHESGSFRHAREIWGPTPAQLRYEGNADLGNTQPGDGERFMGRGLIQLTGRANYRAFTESMRRIFPDAPDFEAEPQLVEEPRWSVYAAGDYWHRRRGRQDTRTMNELADAGEFDLITRRINGGLNGKSDRDARYARAQAALQELQENGMPLPLTPFVAAAATAVLEAAPKLIEIFKGESPVAKRNAEAAKIAVEVAKGAVQAKNEQELVEKLAEPDARSAVQKAIEANWYQLSEAGGGGIEGARAADFKAQADPNASVWRSPSFIIALALLPLVYMIVGSVVGLFGEAWPPEVRAAVAGSVTGAILGGLIGYYYGQTTSRNRVTNPDRP